MATKVGQLKYTVGFDVKKQDLTTLKTQLQQIQKISLSDVMRINDADISTAKKMLNEIRSDAGKVEQALQQAFNPKLNTVNLEKFKASLKGLNIDQIYDSFSRAGAAGEAAFRNLSNRLLTTNVQLKQSHKFLDNIATTLSNTIKWNIASSAVNAMSGAIQQAWGYVKNLDTSLNDIRIVTGKSADEMANFASQANAAAQSLGKTTVDYTKAALIYAQQGLSDEDIATRAAITLKTANVTGQSTDAVSEQLTSVWNGYKVSAEQAELYIDRLAAVAATTASNLEELSTGMSKVAAAAAAMGVGQDQLAAQLSTIISVTRQAPESVGTALRTVYARISDIKAGIDEDGVDLGRYSGKMAELGFNVLDVSGKLRDMGEVMEEIGGKWETLSREQQISLAQTMAGQRQYSNLIALFDNFDKYTQALHTAQNAAGTLQKQQDTYMQGTKAHLNQLKAATENLYDSLVNTDSLEPLIDILTELANGAAYFVDAIGGGGAVLASLGSVATMVFNKQIAQGIQTTITNIQLAKQQTQQFKNMLAQAQSLQRSGKGDDYTQYLNSKSADLLRMSGSLPQNLYEDIQNQLVQLSEASGEYDIVSEKINKLTEELSELGLNLQEQASQWKTIDDMLKDPAGVKILQQELTQLKKSYDPVIVKQKQAIGAFSNLFQNISGSRKEFEQSFTTMKSKMQDFIGTLKTATVGKDGITVFNSLPESAKKAVQEANQNLKKIDFSQFANNQQAAKAIGSIFVQINHTIQLEIDKITKLMEQATGEEYAKLQKRKKQLEVGVKQLENGLNNSFEKASKTISIQSWTKLASAFSMITSSINQIKNIGNIISDKDISNGERTLQIITNIAGTLPSIIYMAKNAGEALSTMTSLSAAAGGWITAIATIVIGATAAIVEYQKAARQIRIKEYQDTIKEENKKQEQIQTNKKLYESLEDVNKQYEQGQITRLELKSTVEDLIDQYNLEQTAVNQLKGSYNNLTEAIRLQRIEMADQAKQSAQREKEAAEKRIVQEASKNTFGSGTYTASFKSNKIPLSGFIEQVTGIPLSSDQEKIESYFKRGSINSVSGALQFGVANTKDSIIQLYNYLSNAIKQIDEDVKNGILTEASVNASEYYTGIVQWINNWTPIIEDYNNALSDLEKYSNEFDVLNLNIDLNEVQTTNQYLEKRIQIIEQLKKLGKDENEAATIADAYLKEYYRDLYIEFDEVSKYIDKLKNKFGIVNDTIVEMISQLGSQSLAYLLDNFDLKDISNWKELQDIIKYLSNEDNAKRLAQLSAAVTPKAANAQQQYDLYSSLSDQIKNSKKQTISKKTFESLDADVQQYFSKVANGQYKLTGDAEEFYKTVNDLSLAGFKQNIQSIIEQQKQLTNIINSPNKQTYVTDLKEKVFDQWNNNNFTLGADNEVFDFLAANGKDVVPWIVKLNSEDIADRADAFAELYDVLEQLEKKEVNYNELLEQQNKIFNANQYAIFSSADTIKELTDLYEQSLQNFGDSTERAKVITELYSAALIDLNEQLDLKNLDTTELENFSNHLQEIAKQTIDLNDALEDNDAAAQIVAKSIMKMNDGFDLLGKNWDAWVDVLQNSTASSEEFAIAMQGAKDALSQLLDISIEYITNDFVAQHLDLITEASNGSAQAIDDLKSAFATSFIQGLIDQQSLQSEAEKIWNVFAAIQTEIPDIEIGAEIKTGNIIEDMNQLIRLLHLDVGQINALFDSMGFEPTLALEEVPVTNTVVATEDQYEETGRYHNGGTDSTGQPFVTDFPFIRHYITEVPQEVTSMMQVPALSNDGNPEVEVITKKATSHFSNYSSRNAGGSASPKSTTKTSTAKPTTKKTKDAVEDTRDIYHDVNIELAEIARNLQRVQKQQQRLYGKQLIDNLNKQSQILEQHKAKLKEKLALQKQDLANQKENLRLLGATFDEAGHISNYMDLLGGSQGAVNGAIASYNSLVNQFNAMQTKEEQEALQDQLTASEEQVKDIQDAHKKLEKAIKDYDSLRNQMEDVVDQVEEETQKQIEIQITKFRIQLEIRLEMGEAQRDWNKFKREVLEDANDILNDSKFNTIFKNANLNYNDIYSYFDVNGSKGSIQKLTEQLNEARQQLDELNASGESAIYSDRKAQLMEHLQSDLSTLMGQMEDIQGLVESIDQAYLDTIDDIKDQFDEQIEDYEFVGELINHDIDLLNLLYGDKNFDAMDSYYTTMHNNQLLQVDSLKQQAAFWKDLWDNATNENDAKKFKQNYEDTIKSLNSLIEESVKTLQEKYTNAINQIFDELDKQLTNGKGTEYVSMEWQLMKKNADEYLDTINSAFAIQELELKYQKTINDTKNVKNQKVLTDLMNEQLSNLRDKEKLTQYDVDRAEKLLEIEKARLALEDSKKNKTSLRLRRDSQGNYSYEYAANEDDVASAQEALLKAQNDLYNFDKNEYRKNLEDMLSAWKDFQSRYKEIVLDTSLTEEERIERLKLLREEYGKYINNKTEENLVIRNNLMDSAFADYAALYDEDYASFKAMTDGEKDALMNDLVPEWNSGVQQMTDAFVAEGGFLPSCQEAFSKLETAADTYKEELGQLEKAAGADFESIKKGIDETAYSFQELITKNDALIKQMQGQLKDIDNLKAALEQLRKAYEKVWKEAEEAAKKTQETLQKERDAAAEEAARAAREKPQQIASGPAGNTSSIGQTDMATAVAASGSGTNSGAGSGKKENPWLSAGVSTTAKGIAGNIYYNGTWANVNLEAGIDKVFANANPKSIQRLKEEVKLLIEGNAQYQEHYKPPAYNDPEYYKETYDYYEMIKKYRKGIGTSGTKLSDLDSLDTGGYTGAWGPEGRLALLHQKQLVLNADDTKNMLDSVGILRGIVQKIGGSITSRLSGLNGGFKNNVANNSDSLEQNVSINASFPNVNSKKEIEEAFNDLVNLAAQRAMRKAK